ncbi:MAG: hypothetical protein J7K46_03085 [Bacteroidales bacterium]|nr:hypothetical protein [Bacteroidales bacterium]
MKSNGNKHIIAILLAGLMLVQMVFVMIPVQDEVLCVAEDHIAIEIPEMWKPVSQAENDRRLIPLHDFHTTDDGACVDIPLQTHTLISGARFSGMLPGHSVLFVENNKISSVEETNVPLFIKFRSGLSFVRYDRHADRSRVLLI